MAGMDPRMPVDRCVRRPDAKLMSDGSPQARRATAMATVTCPWRPGLSFSGRKQRLRNLTDHGENLSSVRVGDVSHEGR